MFESYVYFNGNILSLVSQGNVLTNYYNPYCFKTDGYLEAITNAYLRSGVLVQGDQQSKGQSTISK